MSRFGRKRDELSDERILLRESIRTRGQGQISEAKRTVDDYLSTVVAEGGGRDNPMALAWATDRMRLFLLVGVSSGLIRLLESIPDFPECPDVVAEFQVPARDVPQYGPAHIVAWWWHLQPSLFVPLLESQFGEMKGALVDGVAEGIRSGGDFTSRMVDWDEFFNS